MSIVIPDYEQEAMLQHLVRIDTSADTHLHLYTNDFTPDCSTSFAGGPPFTECSDAAYARQVMAYSDWGIGTPSCVSHVDHGPLSWIFDTDQTLYGYYVTDDADATLIYSERFSTAPITVSAGTSFSFSPRVEMGMCP